MIKVNRGMVELKGPGVIIAMEYATLTHALVEDYPDIMTIATKMITDISKEIENDKTDIDNN